jgi:uncharacterized protein (TIGR03437 family)
MLSLYRCFPLFLTCALLEASAFAQPSALSCSASATPVVVRSEGITERVGDIVVSCSGGAPGAIVTGNLSVFLNVNVTDPVSSANVVSDVALTIDHGSGPQTANVSAVLAGANNLVYNGLSFSLSSGGTATLRLANLRANASQFLQGASNIFADLSFNAAAFTNSQVTVATPERGLYAIFATGLSIQAGHPAGVEGPLPSPTTFASLLSAPIPFFSTRVTEGFAGAFSPLSAPPSLGAMTGTRIVVNYSGFPSGTSMFVPNLVAGSDAIQATAGGDLGGTASAGQYAASANGSLLLALVQNASNTGAGGAPIQTPASLGAGTVSLNSVSQVPLTNGSGYVVYEVVDSNSSVQESAQFPTFVSLPPYTGGPAAQVSETLSFAPVSTVMTASASDPVPRFISIQPLSDCSLVGGCNASYLPHLFTNPPSVQLSAQAGGNYQPGYVEVQNTGGGQLPFTTSVSYQNGSGWLQLSEGSNFANTTIRLDVSTANLSAGTYQATLTINAGPVAGTATIPITLTVTAPPTPTIQPPVIQQVVNGASFGSGVVAGSVATIRGTQFAGGTPTVTLNGQQAQVLFSNATQINIVVPASLSSATTAQAIVTVNGNASAAFTVTLAQAAPGIFASGVLNQDSSVNSAQNPSTPGTILQIFATGLPSSGTDEVQIQGQPITMLYYAGPAPGLPGVQQLDVMLPDDLPSATANLQVCSTIGNQTVCSPAYAVTVSAAPQ